MAIAVGGAFDSFRRQFIDLDPLLTVRARSSRDFLYEQSSLLTLRDKDYPPVTDYLAYGSFARRTKIRPIDDIDSLFILNGRDTIAQISLTNPYSFNLKLNTFNCPLASFNDGNGMVSSTKILNQLKKSLSTVKQYEKSELKRNQEAVVLNLTSYTWVFDVVPAVPIQDPLTKVILYYLIPNGIGGWIATNPKRDTENVTRINQAHNGNFLPLIRMLKFWNSRNHKPRLSSYHFETLALNIFQYLQPIPSLQSGLHDFFFYARTHILNSCPDPKQLGPNLDANLAYETRQRVQQALQDAYGASHEANAFESRGYHEFAMNCWRRVFGPNFPTFG